MERISSAMLKMRMNILIISSPLKMETYNRTTEKGMIESLGLSRWIQAYSDEDEFTIQKIQSC